MYLWCALGNWISWKHQHPLSWPWQLSSLPSGLTSLCLGHQEVFICWSALPCATHRKVQVVSLKRMVWLRRKEEDSLCSTLLEEFAYIKCLNRRCCSSFPPCLFLEGSSTPLFQIVAGRKWQLKGIQTLYWSEGDSFQLPMAFRMRLLVGPFQVPMLKNTFRLMLSLPRTFSFKKKKECGGTRAH